MNHKVHVKPFDGSRTIPPPAVRAARLLQQPLNQA